MVVLPVVLILGLGLGCAAGGTLRGLARVRLRGETLLLLLLASQLLLPLLRLEGLGARLAYAVWFATLPVMVLVCLLNRRIPGMMLAAAGLTANGMAIGLNGGMPVSPAAVRVLVGEIHTVVQKGDFAHVLLQGTTRVPLLGDILPVPGPAGLRSVASVGDVLLVCGVAAVVASGMVQGRDDKLVR